MADFYKNSDKLDCLRGNPILRQPLLNGIQYSVVSDLNAEPIDMAFFKAHCRVDYATDDTLMISYLKAARQHLERFAQKSFGEKKIKLQALNLPANYRLMYGPVDNIDEADYQNFGDILKGGPYSEITINFNTAWLDLPEDIKVAICRYGAGLYAVRENLIYSENGVPHEPEKVMDEAEKMVMPWSNITFP